MPTFTVSLESNIDHLWEYRSKCCRHPVIVYPGRPCPTHLGATSVGTPEGVRMIDTEYVVFTYCGKCDGPVSRQHHTLLMYAEPDEFTELLPIMVP